LFIVIFLTGIKNNKGPVNTSSISSTHSQRQLTAREDSNTTTKRISRRPIQRPDSEESHIETRSDQEEDESERRSELGEDNDYDDTNDNNEGYEQTYEISGENAREGSIDMGSSNRLVCHVYCCALNAFN
jgi:hypothetical protein